MWEDRTAADMVAQTAVVPQHGGGSRCEGLVQHAPSPGGGARATYSPVIRQRWDERFWLRESVHSAYKSRDANRELGEAIANTYETARSFEPAFRVILSRECG